MTAPAPHNPVPADALWTLGCLMVLKGRSDELEVIDAIVPPGYSPPLHRHDFGAESFYVIEGSARFVVGDHEEVVGPGGFVRVPPSTPHSFETLGDAPSRMLDILTPAGLWDFFAEVGEPAAALRLPERIDIPQDLPEVVSRYNGKVLGPPLNRPSLRLQP
jgi:quercetin dioxygenase-like cupin family protein